MQEFIISLQQASGQQISSRKLLSEKEKSFYDTLLGRKDKNGVTLLSIEATKTNVINQLKKQS